MHAHIYSYNLVPNFFSRHMNCLYDCLCSQLLDMKLTVEGLEKERDFYFGKLRDIELICQEHENENNEVLGKIMDKLYATEVNTDISHMELMHADGKYFWVLLICNNRSTDQICVWVCVCQLYSWLSHWLTSVCWKIHWIYTKHQVTQRRGVP